MQRRQLSILMGFGSLLATLMLCTTVVAGTFPVSNSKEYRQMKYRVKAATFLSHATFGPTTEDIEALAERMAQVGDRRACAEWIDHQFSLPATHHHDVAKQMIVDDGWGLFERGQTRYCDYAWWHNVLTAPDQLRQRTAWALMQITVINRNPGILRSRAADVTGEPRYLGIADYYDMLVDNSFESYRDVLYDVSYHPVMGIFLSHRANRPPEPSRGLFPDENYAREIMQLFTIGLHRLRMNGVLMKDDQGQLIPTYDNDDIKAFARVFTGMNYTDPDPNRNFFRVRVNLHEPMTMYDQYHDHDEKVLLNGKVLPAGQSGEKDVADALDNLYHHPNIAPFIARRLIQRLVGSNPSKGYIRRVARRFNNDGRGNRGNMKAVIKAVLLDREALRSIRYVKLRGKPQLEPQVVSFAGNPWFTAWWRYRRPIVGIRVVPRGTEFSKLREPVLRYSSFIRAFHPTSDQVNGYFMLPGRDTDMKQRPYSAPSVFNYYQPDHQPQAFEGITPSRRIPNGVLVGPEFQIFTTVVANRFPNLLRWRVYSQSIRNNIRTKSGNVLVQIFLDFNHEEQLAEDPAALLNHLDLLLCNGTLSDRSKQIIADTIEQRTSNLSSRTRGAILAVLTSPDCAIGE